MPTFKLSAPKYNASVEWSYFAQKCIKFHLQLGHILVCSWWRIVQL